MFGEKRLHSRLGAESTVSSLVAFPHLIAAQPHFQTRAQRPIMSVMLFFFCKTGLETAESGFPAAAISASAPVRYTAGSLDGIPNHLNRSQATSERLSAVEQQRHRAVVDQLDIHVRLELSGADRNAQLPD